MLTTGRTPQAPAGAGPRSALAAYAAGHGAGRGGAPGPDGEPDMMAAMINAARWIRSQPLRARNAAFERIAPMLDFLPPEVVARLRQSPKDDRSLDGFIRQLELLRRRLAGGGAPSLPAARGARGASAPRPGGAPSPGF